MRRTCRGVVAALQKLGARPAKAGSDFVSGPGLLIAIELWDFMHNPPDKVFKTLADPTSRDRSCIALAGLFG
jgi:hypothetical protein